MPEVGTALIRILVVFGYSRDIEVMITGSFGTS